MTGIDLDADCIGFDGPPALRSLPAVIGRTIPAFLLAGGRDVLLGGSPDWTWMV